MTPATRAVLIVEDEPLICLDLQEVLEEAGYEVVGPASTIDEAWRCMRRRELRGALVDLNVGGQFSDGLVKELLHLAVPVVLLTGYSAKTGSAPFNACPVVRKPYEARNLLHVLQYAIEHPRELADGAKQQADARLH